MKGCSSKLNPVVELIYRNLSLSVSVSDSTSKSCRVMVLDNVSGSIRSNTMTALMGESGSGKTSMINALSGRAQYGEVSGKKLLNGAVISADKCRRLFGVVPQDDIIHPELTVSENLVYAGRFTLPESTKNDENEALAESVLLSLGLVGVKDRIVGDALSIQRISGGERRRCSIGIELMSRPKVLIVDEPTSGLDSASANQVMKTLKSLVEVDGMAIMCSIHQPRKAIFDLFDNLVLLASGRQIFSGPARHAMQHYTSQGYYLTCGENVADWLLDIASGVCVNEQATSCSQKTEGEPSIFLSNLYPKDEMKGKAVSRLKDEGESRSSVTSVLEMRELPSLLCQIWTQTERSLLVLCRRKR